ncbi:hypothetical protein HPSA20_0763 [Helicobacter pylori SouthAfrica20]|uniref:Uncharacterized protein n=1 Tax=Helicobacter pylori SouthAfrica20 TaxID=1352356 RepID=T1U9F3_HELPX|nr:hypothetical protein HPSA20_0763 [Helicobacter pylori SouthAfrica20]
MNIINTTKKFMIVEPNQSIKELNFNQALILKRFLTLIVSK